jgi:hypothetical protein
VRSRIGEPCAKRNEGEPVGWGILIPHRGYAATQERVALYGASREAEGVWGRCPHRGYAATQERVALYGASREAEGVWGRCPHRGFAATQERVALYGASRRPKAERGGGGSRGNSREP